MLVIDCDLPFSTGLPCKQWTATDESVEALLIVKDTPANRQVAGYAITALRVLNRGTALERGRGLLRRMEAILGLRVLI